jgi:hypothetical protein
MHLCDNEIWCVSYDPRELHFLCTERKSAPLYRH